MPSRIPHILEVAAAAAARCCTKAAAQDGQRAIPLQYVSTCNCLQGNGLSILPLPHAAAHRFAPANPKNSFHSASVSPNSVSRLAPGTMVYLNQNATWYIERWFNIRIGDLFIYFVCLGFVCASIGMLLHGALKDRCLSLEDRGRCDRVSYCVWNVSSGYCHRP